VSFDLGLCLLGGAAGWTAGILGTPLDSDERTSFSGIWKAFLAIGSGFVVAKLEGAIVRAVGKQLEASLQECAIAATLFSTCFLVGLLFTLVSRLYGGSEGTRKERRVAVLLAQAAEIAEKLHKAREG
jgi:Na+/melibiose symporter-like transporter